MPNQWSAAALGHRHAAVGMQPVILDMAPEKPRNPAECQGLLRHHHESRAQGACTSGSVGVTPAQSGMQACRRFAWPWQAQACLHVHRASAG